MASKEFFDSLTSRADASRLAGMNNTYLFDIEGEGQWLVAVADGALTVTEGGGEADTTITTTGGDVRQDRRGRAEPDDGVHDGQAEDQGRHGCRHEASEALLAGSLQLDEDRAAGDSVSLGDRDRRDRRGMRARGAASPSSSPRGRRAGRRASTREPGCDVHLDHGAGHRRSDRARAAVAGCVGIGRLEQRAQAAASRPAG